MTIDSETYTYFVQRGQDALRATVETWTQTVKAATGQVSAFAGHLDAEAAVDRYFDLGEKVLDAQRDFAKRLFSGGAAIAATVKV